MAMDKAYRCLDGINGPRSASLDQKPLQLGIRLVYLIEISRAFCAKLLCCVARQDWKDTSIITPFLSKNNKNTFVSTRGMDSCIWVYPLSQWYEIEKSLRSLSSLSRIHRTFVRNTARYAFPSTYDKQGRINLTPSLIRFASLKKDVLIIGMVNKMEIWDPEQLKEADNKIEKINPEEYDNLADRIIL